MARPTPVFPEVGSIRTVRPGAIVPRFWASSIIENPIRSWPGSLHQLWPKLREHKATTLTELHGSMLSSFNKISAFPGFNLPRRRSGVRPMRSVMLFAILGCARETDGRKMKEFSFEDFSDDSGYCCATRLHSEKTCFSSSEIEAIFDFWLKVTWSTWLALLVQKWKHLGHVSDAPWLNSKNLDIWSWSA